jgi:hypothetical protein
MNVRPTVNGQLRPDARASSTAAGSEVVETSETGSGAGAGIAAGLIALLMLVILFLGFTQWNWFGATTRSSSPGGTQTISSPAPGAGGGTAASPSAMPSSSS